MSKPRSFHKIEMILAKMREGLLTVAMTDSRLSHDENHIIHEVDNYLPKLRNLLKDIYRDGRVDQEEKTKMNELLKEMMNEAIGQAKFDKIVQREENLILQQLRNDLISIMRALNE